ncbi:hypothetical protein Glove_149g89 [Diversispora epigaea]|uniref:Uncharacterized protein n=1 Tax=Diversispora epigaea TaxID=1348612 RepID=A0A397IZY0_9GLOM|nr:hypothetical protein Glove_149g89 [Diversispora epigaea]
MYKEITSWFLYRKNFEKRHSEVLPEILKNKRITIQKAHQFASGRIYDEMLQYLSGISRINLRKKTQLTKPIYKLFTEIGEDKIKRIKTYSANKLSKLTDTQIDTIKKHFIIEQRETNSRTHMTEASPVISTPKTEKKVSLKIPDNPKNNRSRIINKVLELYLNVSLRDSSSYFDSYVISASQRDDAYKITTTSSLCPCM